MHEDRAQFLIITWPAESELVDPIICSINYVFDTVAYLFGMEVEYFTINLIDQQFQPTMIMWKITQLRNTQESVG